MNFFGFFKRNSDFLALVCGIHPDEGCSAHIALAHDVKRTEQLSKFFILYPVKTSVVLIYSYLIVYVRTF